MSKKLGMTDPVLTRVWWTDTTNVAGGWHNDAELLDFALNKKWDCENVGWLVYEDRDCIVLAGRLTTDGDNFGLVERIPTAMIVKRETVDITSPSELLSVKSGKEGI